MTLLLDTHAWLWFFDGSDRLPARARDAISRSEDQLLWSTVCVWEMTTKHALGKLILPEPPPAYVRSRMAVVGAAALPIAHEHAMRLGALPPHHKDPFDRLLIAQAQVEELTLVSGDPKMAPYELPLLWE